MTTTTTLTTEIEDRTHNKRYIHVYSPTHTHVKRTDAKCYEVLQISTTDLDNDADDDDDDNDHHEDDGGDDEKQVPFVRFRF